MASSEPRVSKWIRFCEGFYLVLLVLSFYFLLASRTGEARTIWEVMHPMFIPTFFVATSLLIMILFAQEKASYKMLLVVTHSVLLHSFFSVIFPAGDISGQQMYLGRIRFAFDSTSVQDWPQQPILSVQSLVFQMFRGTNFQAALSTVFARLLSVDIFYVHLFLVPVLWGLFTPVAVYLITRTLGGDETASALSSLIISAFPLTIYFGAISVPNSLGFILFLYALYFMLRHLASEDSLSERLMVVFSLLSFLSHYLAGVLSISLLLLTLGFKAYRVERLSPRKAVTLMIPFFIVSTILLPSSFIFLRFFNTSTNALFTLDKLYELPLQEIIGLFFLGGLVYGYDLKTIIVSVVGPSLGLLGMIYLLRRAAGNRSGKSSIHIYFIFASLLIVLVDYRILKIFMTGLPINEERLWVFRDFLSTPFVALLICATVSFAKASIETRFKRDLTAVRKTPLKAAIPRASGLLLLNILVAVLLSGWVVASLNAAYPHASLSLQTTSYELEATRYIEQSTHEKYVVIGDIWTIYAGEMVVGIYNPRAFYFGEQDPRWVNLFNKMLNEPSPSVMIEAMNQTGAATTTAYFVVTKPRLSAEDYNHVIQQVQQSGIQVYKIFYYPEGEDKLTVFRYQKPTNS